MSLGAVMEIKKKQDIQLEENQTFSFKEARTVHIDSGQIWMTVEGDREDYFFKAGDSFLAEAGKHTVLQALGKSSFWF